MSKKFFLCLFFACFGITAEICFTAISRNIAGTPLCGDPAWSLTGKTYVWMIFIYILIPFLAGPIIKRITNWQILLRLLFYAILILVVEFISGFLLEQITGKCPWEYTTGWHIMGYIRLDYIPSWMFFAFWMEYLYLYIDKNLNPAK
jgi:hypothetical protein